MPARQPNKQLNLTVPGSLPVRIGGYQRRRMYERFLSETKVSVADKILDVGVSADVTYETSNYLEQWYADKSAITAVGLDNAAHLKQLYGVRFVMANGLHLPFRDTAFGRRPFIGRAGARGIAPESNVFRSGMLPRRAQVRIFDDPE